VTTAPAGGVAVVTAAATATTSIVTTGMIKTAADIATEIVGAAGVQTEQEWH